MGLSPVSQGGISVFLAFLMGFSVNPMGLETIGWGFSKTDGVPVELVESQWDCLESHWGRLLMGMLQGVVPNFSQFMTGVNVPSPVTLSPKIFSNSITVATRHASCDYFFNQIMATASERQAWKHYGNN